MSIWGDMRRKSSGDVITKEDFSLIYYDNDSAKKPLVTLEEKEYKGYKYMVITCGDFPILDIRVSGHGISVFSGHNLVILKFDDGRQFELDRILLNGNETKYVYDFNKDGDYIHSSAYDRCTEEGHKYSVQEVEKYAEMFIDKLIESEDDKYKHTE